MKITTQQELDDLIATANESNTIVLNEDLEITFDCIIPCNIKVYGNIEAKDIDAYNITAYNIDAPDIDAYNIDAYNITAGNIKAKNIKYYAFCIAYDFLRCESIAGERKNSFHKCLDREIKIVKEEEKTILTAFELTQSQIDKIKHLIQCKN